jgi:hypothetical protein
MTTSLGLRRLLLRLIFITTDKHNKIVAASATGTAHRGARCCGGLAPAAGWIASRAWANTLASIAAGGSSLSSNAGNTDRRCK